MTFQKAEDTNYYYHRMTTGRIDIGVFPTMFGWRVRAGYTHSMWIELDWACGDRPAFVWGTYLMLKEMIERGIRLEDLPPRNAVTPWVADTEFAKRIFKHDGCLKMDPPEIPDFEAIRNAYLENHTLLQR